jgi:hypothetical protein
MLATTVEALLAIRCPVHSHGGVGSACIVALGGGAYCSDRIRALTGTPTPAALCLELLNAGRCCNLECHHDGECNFTAATPEPTPMAVPLRLRADKKLVNGIGAMIKRTRGYSFTINSTEIGLILDTVEAFLAERDRTSRPPGEPAK